MKKTNYWIPVILFSLWPFIGFYSSNAKEAPNIESLFYLFLIFNLPIYIFLGIYSFLTKKKKLWPTKMANALCIFIVLLFQYNFIKLSLAGLSDFNRVHWLIWPPLLAIFAGLTLRFSGTNFTKILTTVGIVLNLMPVVNIATHIVQVNQESVGDFKDDPLDLENTNLKSKPNIYHIVLDAYAREDLLEKGFAYDNTGFSGKIRDRGFDIMPDSYSNYISTHISIPSTLQMNYPFVAGDKVPAGKFKLFNVTQGKNRFVSFIKRAGYRYVHFQNGYYDGGLCRGVEDECIYSQKPRPLRDTERNFLALTPGLFLVDKVFFKTAKFKSGVNEIRKWKENDKSDQPTYLYAHILNPHPPYLFQPDCSHRENAHEGMRDYAPEKYLTQVKCLSREVIKLIDAIKERDKNPIILIHADHGPYFGQSPLDGSDNIPFEALQRRFAILNAYHFSNHGCDQHLYDSISPINSLRLIISCLQGKQPPFLPDKHFLSKGIEHDTDHGYELREVFIPKKKIEGNNSAQ